MSKVVLPLCFSFRLLIWLVVIKLDARARVQGAECPSLCSWLSPKWFAQGDSFCARVRARCPPFLNISAVFAPLAIRCFYDYVM